MFGDDSVKKSNTQKPRLTVRGDYEIYANDTELLRGNSSARLYVGDCIICPANCRLSVSAMTQSLQASRCVVVHPLTRECRSWITKKSDSEEE